MGKVTIAHTEFHFQERDYNIKDKSGRTRDIFLLDKHIDA